MRRASAFFVTGIVSLLIGIGLGAVLVRRLNERELGHWYVMSLMDRAYAAREVYAGRSRELADHLREKLPEQVLGVENEFRRDETRNTAFRLVSEAYAASNTEVPVELRAILAAVPPRPSREVPNAAK
jgi:hypothetical protein